jgi:hypothetical protein
LVDVDALPVSAAVIVPAVKFPEASRATIALAVFDEVAVVAEFETLSAVEIVASFVSAIAAEALISPLTIVPSRIIVLVTVPVSPVVTTVPVVAGNVIVTVPAMAAGWIVKFPLVEPGIAMLVMPVSPRFADARLRVTAVVPMYVVSAKNATVPVLFGNVIVLSAVGSVIWNVVSYASSDEPSKINEPDVPSVSCPEMPKDDTFKLLEFVHEEPSYVRTSFATVVVRLTSVSDERAPAPIPKFIAWFTRISAIPASRDFTALVYPVFVS